MKSLCRRSVLRGIGAVVALPLLDAMLGSPFKNRCNAADSQFKPWQKTIAQQPRLICCYVPNGVNIHQWSPQQDGTDYELSPTLEVLKSHRHNFTVLTGLGHPASTGGHSGADTWLTGADLTAIPGNDYSNSVSIDQVIAEQWEQHTRFASLQLSDSSGTGSAGHSHTLSFNKSGTPLPAENSPRQLFDRLFTPEAAGDRAAILRRYSEKKSVLDAVKSEVSRLEKSLGPADRQKLNLYLDSVRETEQRVARMENWVDIPKPQVSPSDLQLASQPGNAHDRPMWIDVMLELSYLAFVTDTTRVITFQWSREAGGFGGGGENHHELSHHGGDPGMLEKLAVIDRFHLARLNRFLTLLNETMDGERSMLDHSVVLYGSGMNSGAGGEHSPKNLPTLLAGGTALGFRHGQHAAFNPDNHPPLANLMLTIAQKLGLQTDSFRDSTGTLSTLSS